MPTGIPKAGYRKTKWREAKSREEIERELAFRTPEIIAELEKLTKPFPCPHCGNIIKIIDKDVGMYLVDRVLGKPKQRTELDITEATYRQLTGDEIYDIIMRILASPKAMEFFQIAPRALLPEAIEGEYKEV